MQTLPRITLDDGIIVQTPIIHNDIASLVLCTLLGFIGGLTVASTFMRQSGVFKKVAERKIASNWVTISISTSCVISGIASIPVAKYIQ